jgi:hypothetical protein
VTERRGIIVIATGRYVGYVRPLLDSVRRHRAADHVFVLSDTLEPGSSGSSGRAGRADGVTWLPWGHVPWPAPTLLRYHAITSYAALLRDTVDRLLYLDVDMRVVGSCEQLWGPDLIAVAHPGYRDTPPAERPYESRPASRAFTLGDASVPYVAGGVQGGSVETFLQVSATLRDAISADLAEGLIARWHDESHWNAFCAAAGGTVSVLGPEHCWPQSWVHTATDPAPVVLALDKDHHRLRGTRAGWRSRARSLTRVLRTP